VGMKLLSHQKRENLALRTSGNARVFLWKAASSVRPRLLVAILAALIVQSVATASLYAQTLANPNPPTRASATTAPSEDKQPKPCPAYGPGFVQIPGSNACVKIGGSVQVQGSSH
jgi:hypothetical protein